MLLMRLKIRYNYKKVKYYKRITFKAGVNFIRGDHQFLVGKPVGNYRVKLNKKLTLSRNSGVGGVFEK
jgi:hypothetical protein